MYGGDAVVQKKILCIALSLIFIITGCSVSGEKIDNGQEFNSTDQKNDSLEDFKENISDIFDENNKGTYALYVWDIAENKICSIDSRKMQAASLIKLFVAGTVYENYDIVSEYLGGEKITKHLLKEMITVSDNEAMNHLTIAIGKGKASVGLKKVNNYAKHHGYYDTHLGKLLLQNDNSDENYTSVEDCGKFLYDIYMNRLKGSDKILDYMKKQERTSKIPSGIPEDVVVANKTGELSDVENDVAIVFTKGHPYIICIMADRLEDTYTARLDEAKISEEIYNYILDE